ncbi:hypothetical protein FA15DRAFT_231762 [Coprinopsis marcescibilis]|uniref:Uncharacterized protein n=1 Tax=Coprinopsis marcescibilis TaxID=230819 RepID=A0A5C3KGH4_COPMA|nr:hypothetical protein FA15DRAFT_231762 [Coprinopsis marcescibilis]
MTDFRETHGYTGHTRSYSRWLVGPVPPALLPLNSLDSRHRSLFLFLFMLALWTSTPLPILSARRSTTPLNVTCARMSFCALFDLRPITTRLGIHTPCACILPL